MMAMFDRIEFVLSEAFVSLRRNTWMTFATITTSAMALVLLGGLGLMWLDVSRFAREVADRFEMSVFIREGIEGEQLEAVRANLEALEGVKEARFVSQDELKERFMKDNPTIPLEELGVGNPFPHSFILTLSELDRAEQVAASAQAMPEVEPDGVQYLQDIHGVLTQARRMVPWFGLTLGSVMLLTGGILIYNSIRMTILARRRETRIMMLVGATRATVVSPLLIEGMIQGAVGGLLAALTLWPVHAYIQNHLLGAEGIRILSDYPLGMACVLLGLTGGVYGLACSWASVRDIRRVR